MKIDESSTTTDPIKITGEGVSVSDITYVKDESLFYNPECQLEICYTIYFKLETSVPLGTRILLDIDNLLNPESIIIAGDL
jgi:hypothetical protein